MKVRLSLDFNDYARYVIAKFYAPAATSAQDKARPRATRHQVRRFVEAALSTTIRAHAKNLRTRSRKTAERLEAGTPQITVETLPSPQEEQRSLQW